VPYIATALGCVGAPSHHSEKKKFKKISRQNMFFTEIGQTIIDIMLNHFPKWSPCHAHDPISKTFG
jgi:hypothetical protein